MTKPIVTKGSPKPGGKPSTGGTQQGSCEPGGRPISK